MKLNILPLSQRDERWKLKRLGNSTLTIGSYGCLLTCHSMSLIYFGHDLTPDLLNEVYKTKGVFDEALINFYAAGTVFEDFKAIEYYNCYEVPCDLKKIDDQLIKKQPVIAMVDFDLNPNTKGDWHFVLIIGKTDDGHYLVNDPWNGETYFFDAKYGDPLKNIYGLRIYEGIPKVDTANEDTLADMQDKLQSCNTMLAEKALEANGLRDELAIQEKDNEDLAGQLSEARSQRDKVSWENDQLTAKNKALVETLADYKKQTASLKEENTLLKKQTITNLSSTYLIGVLIGRLFGKEVS